jgi:hypothetical protein|tara:strand:- start:14 stop:217 length:204 start_codon:yes stop_codon:yes gene_type:complete
MTEEFNLSDKMREAGKYTENEEVIHTSEVKEFIKELKEINQKFWDMGHFNPKTMDEQIDKLVGDKLK